MIGGLRCWWDKKHLWRKARKGEDASRKYCTRCGESVAVAKRTKKETQS